MSAVSILWRRLDTPGHDACRLEGDDAGWRLEGTAVFRHQESSAQLTYSVVCDRSWRTQRGQVRGRLGLEVVDLHVARTSAGIWSLNGAVAEGLGDCVDLDFGFTPATNLSQLRRLDLIEGQAADVPVAWLDVSGGTLDRLQQRYERRETTAYWYEAPRFDYAALLEVTPDGFVRRYPGLWEMEP
jgi:uncharacterized protein